MGGASSNSSKSSPRFSKNLLKSEEEIVKLMLPVFYTTDPISINDIKLATSSWHMILKDQSPQYLFLREYSKSFKFYYKQFKQEQKEKKKNLELNQQQNIEEDTTTSSSTPPSSIHISSSVSNAKSKVKYDDDDYENLSEDAEVIISQKAIEKANSYLRELNFMDYNLVLLTESSNIVSSNYYHFNNTSSYLFLNYINKKAKEFHLHYHSCVTYFYDRFYTRLFNVHPECKVLFMNHDKKLKMKSQGKFLVQMITLMLSSLDDKNVKNFDNILIKLTEVHYVRGVKAVECMYNTYIYTSSLFSPLFIIHFFSSFSLFSSFF